MYSRSDWVLAFLYRSSSFSRYVAGLHAVEHLDTKTVLENVDVTALVTGVPVSLSLSLLLSLSLSVSVSVSVCVYVCVSLASRRKRVGGWGGRFIQS